MPKIVDHDLRRAELARAVWAVVGRDGIEGATVRRVAEQAGLSMGGLRHYFDSQAGLLRFAALAVGDNIGARVAAVLASPGDDGHRARLMVEAMLPLDEERRIEAEVWLACLVRSRVDGSLAELRTAGWAGTRHVCRLAVALSRGAEPPHAIGAEPDEATQAGQADKSAPTDKSDRSGAIDENGAGGGIGGANGMGSADLERRAERLHALVDGLTLHAITYPDRATPQSLRAAVEQELRP